MKSNAEEPGGSDTAISQENFDLYESHLTSHFFRLWGAREGKAGISPDTSLLGNAQNFFDSAVGDVAGKVGCQYFFIEFKRTRSGIAEEIKAAGKPHRHALYTHLLTDEPCRMLSYIGHFAAYQSDDNTIVFEQYLHSAAQRATKTDGKSAVLAYDMETIGRSKDAGLNLPGYVWVFDRLYDSLTLAPGGPSQPLGWDKDEMQDYINCMYEHLIKGEQVSKNGNRTMLGVYDPDTKEFTGFVSSLEHIVASLHAAFEKIAKLKNKSSLPGASRKH